MLKRKFDSTVVQNDHTSTKLLCIADYFEGYLIIKGFFCLREKSLLSWKCYVSSISILCCVLSQTLKTRFVEAKS